MRLPSYYLSHGGGPWPYMQGPARQAHAALEAALRALPLQLARQPPRAVLMISAHWEAPEFTVMTHARPPMLYDYGGFPAHTYQVQYPAPGSPALAQQVQSLMHAAGLHCAVDAQRGYDHGAFVPLAVMYPEAELPVVQLSLKAGLAPEAHLALGQALAPLRDEGVLIIGSGSSFHNLALRGPAVPPASQAFDAWLGEVLMTATPDQRRQRIARWTEAPAARQAHAREEHLLPLMVALGAALDEPAERVYHEDGFFGGATVSSFRFGAASAQDLPIPL